MRERVGLNATIITVFVLFAGHVDRRHVRRQTAHVGRVHHEIVRHVGLEPYESGVVRVREIAPDRAVQCEKRTVTLN